MAGGTWKTQNKVRPGSYINILAAEQESPAASRRGVMTMPLNLSWGDTGKLIAVNCDSDVYGTLGYGLNDILLLREALKRAKTVLLYRVNGGGAKAAATVGTALTVTAKYAGTRGNDIKVGVAKNVDDNLKFDVTTYVGTKEVETQTVSSINGLRANDFVVFSGTGAPAAAAATSLTGGTDAAATAENFAAYFTAAAGADFDTMAVPVNDSAVKALAVEFAKRMRENEGKKIQVVLPDCPTADYEGVISVKNGVVLSDGTVIDKVKAVAWVGGATAGAGVAESLTYSEYEGAVSVDTVYTNSEIEAALKAGEFLFTESYGRIATEQDINTLLTYGDAKSYALSKNRVLRVIDGYCSDLKKMCDLCYVGKIGNNADGRNTVKAFAIKLAAEYESLGALQNFDSESDITVGEGPAIDSMTLTVRLQPVDSVEKIYATITVGEGK
ncbi:MAG: phage tail sheath family protein [Bacillota bacterium]|nr:phage tail sheath family protein [Bacillota bacterium]